MRSFFFEGINMEKKRIIFDLDRTIMTSGSYKIQEDYFRNIYGEEANDFISKIGFYLSQYEFMFPRYTTSDLASFLRMTTGLKITDKIVLDWINLDWTGTDILEPGIIDLLEELRMQDKNLIILTNWFLKTQLKRLEDKGILDYFDEVIGGDICLKPHRNAYDLARGEYSRRDCLLVGDDLYKDYLGAVFNDIDAVLYDKEDKHGNNLVKVKRTDEVIKMV